MIDQGVAYDLFGLSFISDEPIPGLTPSRSPSPEDAIRIEFGSVPASIRNPDYADETVQVTASQYLFTYPGVLRLVIEGDRRIVVQRLEDWDPVRLWTCVLGVGPSITGFRRGHIPLHASSVLKDGRCFAFAGQSGAGKSTIAALLCERGFELFADDLCLVQLDPGGAAFAGQGVTELRLWDDAVAALDWTDIKPFAVQPNVNKSVFRRAAPIDRTAGLQRIYTLAFTAEGEEPGIHRLHGVEAMQALVGCLRMRMALLGLGQTQRPFERLAAISDQVEMFRFSRPLDHAQSRCWLDRLVDHFEA